MPNHSASSHIARTLLLPRRQVFLFLLVVCLTCAWLLVLGARTVIRDREFSAKRMAERRQQLADAVARALLDRLERIELEEATAFAAYRARDVADRLADGSTVFVAPFAAGLARMDRTADPYATRTERVLAAPEFAAPVATGLHAELGANRFDSAAASLLGICILACSDDASAPTVRDIAVSHILSISNAKAAAKTLHWIQFSGDITNAPMGPTALSTTKPGQNVSLQAATLTFPSGTDLGGCGSDGTCWEGNAGTWNADPCLTATVTAAPQ